MSNLVTQLAITNPMWLYALPVCLSLLAWLLWRRPGSVAALSSLILSLARRVYRHPEYAQLHALRQTDLAQHATRHWLR